MASKRVVIVVVLAVISQISAFPTPAGPDGELLNNQKAYSPTHWSNILEDVEYYLEDSSD